MALDRWKLECAGVLFDLVCEYSLVFLVIMVL